MIEKNEKETLAISLGNALEKSRKGVIAVSIFVVVLIIAVAVVATLKSKAIQKGIELVDSISYSLTHESAELSDADISARQEKALDDLTPLIGKDGVVGLRANMLYADIKFNQKDYELSRSAWLKAAEAKKDSYTAAICYYNAAVCSENLGDTENAISYYKSASDDEEFLLIDHALFSLGRVNEEAKKYEDAKSAYEKLSELRPNSNWAQLAKTRLISLKTSGNI